MKNKKLKNKNLDLVSGGEQNKYIFVCNMCGEVWTEHSTWFGKKIDTDKVRECPNCGEKTGRFKSRDKFQISNESSNLNNENIFY